MRWRRSWVDEKPLAIDLAATQRAWVDYRRFQCSDAYELHRDGSIRHHLAQACLLTLTRERTHAIWAVYLTFFDSTAPVLPEP